MQAITKTVAIWMVIFAAAISVMTFVSMDSALAACDPSSGIQGGVDCVEGNINNTADLESVVFDIINTLLFIIGILAVIMLIVGGIRYVVSGGNQSSVDAARNTILYAIVGLVIAFVAYGVVNFVIKALVE